MDTDEKPTPLWLRLCGAAVGALLGALGGAALFFLGAVLGAFSGGITIALFIGSISFASAFVGFLLPRQTMNSLCIFLPGGFSD